MSLCMPWEIPAGSHCEKLEPMMIFQPPSVRQCSPSVRQSSREKKVGEQLANSRGVRANSREFARIRANSRRTIVRRLDCRLFIPILKSHCFFWIASIESLADTFLPNSISALEGCRDFVLGAKSGSISKSQWDSTHILKISAKTDENVGALGFWMQLRFSRTVNWDRYLRFCSFLAVFSQLESTF